jgi:APA family basic amino acid/polyamine antiporter
MKSQAAPRKVELVQGLGLLDATMIVVGSMIGSGIFIVSADVARQIDSPGGFLIVWLLSCLMTMVGALSLGELAALMPQAGGVYVYLREAYGPLCGFLYGWGVFVVIGSATIAVVAVAFAKFTGIFFPWFSSSNWIWEMGVVGPYTIGVNAQNLLAIASIVFLTLVNMRGVRAGALVQNMLTFAKTGAVVGLVAVGLTVGRNATAVSANFENMWRNLDWSPAMLVAIVVAMVGPLFASTAWENSTFTAAETRNPRRNVPLSLALGSAVVLTLYMLINFTYLTTLPLGGAADGVDVVARGIRHAAEDRVGAASAEAILGPLGGYLMATAIMISTFGCNNGLILSYPRVYYAMARDGLFFARLGELHPRTYTPNAALALQGVWASALTLTGTYSDLLDYIIAAVLIFYAMTIASLFVFRRTRPDAERPYRAPGYPVVPALYLAFAVLIEVCLLVEKPRYTWPGFLIVAAGIPVYFLWRRRLRLRPAVSG